MRVPHNLYFLHGFLGSPQDWEKVIAFLPEYVCQPLSYPFALPDEGILIGYSMGGRIALPSLLPKILISAHPGLQTDAEKTARQKKEQEWLVKLRTHPLLDFLDEWYRQPLFESLRNHPIFPELIQRRLKQDRQLLLHQLETHSLAAQPFQKPLNALFLHGELDTTYRDLYQRLKIDSCEIRGVGHAPHLENPELTAAAIRLNLEEIAKLRFGAKSAPLPLDSISSQIAYSQSSMSQNGSGCEENEPTANPSNLASKASFAIPS